MYNMARQKLFPRDYTGKAVWACERKERLKRLERGEDRGIHGVEIYWNGLIKAMKSVYDWRDRDVNGAMVAHFLREMAQTWFDSFQFFQFYSKCVPIFQTTSSPSYVWDWEQGWSSPGHIVFTITWSFANIRESFSVNIILASLEFLYPSDPL